MLNRLYSFLLLSIVSLMAIACESVNNTEPKKTFTIIADESGFDDMSFNYSGKLGMQRLAEQYDINVIYRTIGVDGTVSDVLSQAAANSDLTICLGYTFADALDSVANAFPSKLFSIIDYNFRDRKHNINSSTFDVKQATYPLGYLAAAISKDLDSAKSAVGFIGGDMSEEINQFLVGFRAGIRRYDSTNNMNTDLQIEYVNSFSDSAKCYQIAKSMIANGAKVIFPPAGKSGLGAFAAAKEFGVYAIGYDVDCAVVLPDFADVIISSCLKRIDNAVFAVGDYYLKNRIIQPAPYFGTLKNEGVAIAPFHRFDAFVPASTRNAIDTIIQSIKSKAITF